MSVFKTVGIFEEKLIYGEDVDWFMRAWENNIVKHRLDCTFLLYRRHDKNMTNNIMAKNKNKVLLFKLKLERQKTMIKCKNTVGYLRDYLGDLNISKL
jgi:GT2 family glycosyltransferase